MKTAKRGARSLQRPCSTSVFDKPPLDMDVESRNERLYDTLLKMGLYVSPLKGAMGGIGGFIVSCQLPHQPLSIEQSQG
jgi:hypothetical protein